ncbi:putative oxido [Cyphellophora attinorum]|uniref:Putative oxido n=1 Tax=Cyphellophora attinorum TaxID=1664694 RepID=A0A0N1H7D6_9EURO|nr:putative oxido [Phialophora attinorum]KPI42406.1 putative oxido [Phialophora attinorum]
MSTSNKGPVKVGLIGWGGSANVYNLPYLIPNPNLHLYAIHQRKGPKDPGLGRFGHCTDSASQQRLKDWGCATQPKWYQSQDEFFADPEIEVVVVTTGHGSHFSLAKASLEAGKHVLVEKPFVTRASDANELIKLAKEKGLILTVYQNRRWDSEFLTLQKLLKQDALGELTDVTIHYDFEMPAWIQGWTQPEYEEGSGAGMLYGLGTHSLDQALLVLGRPERVTGFIRSLRVGEGGERVVSEVDDTFMAVLEYGKERPVVCTVKTTVVNIVEQPLKYFVRGRKGTFTKRGECVQEKQTNEGMKSTDEGFGQDEERDYGDLVTVDKVEGAVQNWDEGRKKWIGKFPTESGYWRGLYENLAKAVRGEEEIKVKAEQSRDGLRLIELVRESVRKGSSVLWTDA